MGKNRKKTSNLMSMLMLSLLLVFCFVLPVQASEYDPGENTEQTTEENTETPDNPDVPETPEVPDTSKAKSFTAESVFVIDTQTGLITGYNEPNAADPAKEIIIPATIRGTTVKGLSGTFKGNTTINRVILPDTIEVIGNDTFNGCTGLSTICVYDPSDGKAAADVKPESEDASVDWSNYVIDGSKFYAIIDRGAIIIPTGLKTLGDNVFNSCTFSCFDVMEGNTAFSDSGEGGLNLKEGVGVCLMSKDKKILYRLAPGYGPGQGATEKYELPEGIVEIYPYAMHKTSIKEIVIPTTTVQIDDYAFYEVGGHLDKVTFAETSHVEKIGQWAFARNSNMSITLPSSVKSIGAYCFAHIVNRTPDLSKSSITELPAYVFDGCENLHTITMPKTLRIIRGYAFAGCDNLNEVIFLGDTLDTIEKGAFQDCQNMHKIKIPEGVTAIEDDTFAGCTNLEEVGLPDSLESIGDNAFGGCQNIKDMVIPENVKHIHKDSFKGVPPENLKGIDTSKNEYAQGMIKKPLPAVGETVTAGPLKYKIVKSDKKKGTVTVVGAIDKKQKKITIPDKVKICGYDFKVISISNKAFKKNKKLTTVVIGANVKTIGTQAFANCNKLKKITVKSKKITKVGSKAFKGIHKKAKIKLPKMNSKKFKKYKNKFLKKGQASTVKITK